MIKAALTKDFSTVLLYILSNTIKDDPITKITTEFVYAIHLLHHNFIPQQVILPGCECSVNSRVGTSSSTVWAEKIDTVKKRKLATTEWIKKA